LEVHQLDVLPEREDRLLARGLAHVDDLGQLRAELEALRVFVAVQVDGDVHVLVPVALERELVKVGHGGQVACPRRCPVRLLPLDAGVRALPRLLAIEVHRQGLEEVRQPGPLGRRGRLGLVLAGGVGLHLVAVGLSLAGLGFLLVRLQFRFVVEKSALDLDAV
jgi:hypothetical protein